MKEILSEYWYIAVYLAAFILFLIGLVIKLYQAEKLKMSQARSALLVELVIEIDKLQQDYRKWRKEYYEKNKIKKS